MKNLILISLASITLMSCSPKTPATDTVPADTNAPASAAKLDDGLIIKPSAHSVSVTIDRLEAAAKSKGLNVFARIDHHQNAANMGLDMPASTLLIFGSPKIGAPLMNASSTIGIDLPVKALAYEEDGKVYLSYNDPAYLQMRHGLTDTQSMPLRKMSKAVGGLTNKAVSTD